MGNLLMSEHYPRIRVRAENGCMVLREGLSISFYLHRPHDEVKQSVMRSLDVYLRAVGPQTLRMYPDAEGEWQPLDDAGWKHQRGELLSSPSAHVLLAVDGW
jgi:hypothetical protein